MLQEEDNVKPSYFRLFEANIFLFFGLANQQLCSLTNYTLKNGNDIQNSENSLKILFSQYVLKGIIKQMDLHTLPVIP